MVILSPPEDRDPEAIGTVIGRRFGRQEMEEDCDEREQSSNVGV